MRKFLDEKTMHQVAIFKSNHPDYSVKELSDLFQIKQHQVRYAIEKFGNDMFRLSTSKKGRQTKASMMLNSADDNDLIKSQLNTCVKELENNMQLALSTRVDLLHKITRIKIYIQDVELQGHMKSVDATLIAGIIRRFIPNASNDDIIKIYNEERVKQNG
jgi:hypothetical protein